MKKVLIILCIISSITFTGCTKNDGNNMDNGNNAFNQKDYISAIKFYKKEIKKNPQNAQAYSQYCGAECYTYDSNKKIDLNNTLLLCDKSIELNSNIAETYFYKGRIYGQLGKSNEAIQEYSNAIKINPNYERAYLNRGVTKSVLGMTKDAISDYSKAIELNNEEDLVLAYSNRGFAYAQIGEKQKADADFKKVSNLDIKNGTSRDYALRGEAKSQIKDFIGAVFDFKKAIELDNTKIEYYLPLATVQGMLKDFDGAIDTCSKGIEKVKENTEALYMMRGVARGSKELAMELSDRGKQHNFTESSADLKMAQNLALKNNNQEVYKKSIEAQNTLQDLAIKMRSISQNVSLSFGVNDANKIIKTQNGHTTISYTTTKTTNSSRFISKEGNLNGIFSNDIKISKNKTLVIRGSMSGNIQVESGATLINYGNVSGDINNNGHTINHGNMSGDINNNGFLEIYGINTGDINTNKNIYIDKNAIVKGKINKF